LNTPAEKYGLDKPSTDWGRDGNAYAIMGAVARALKSEGYPAEAIDEYREASTSGDYDHLLRTAMEWCDIDMPEDEYDEDDEDEVECAQCGGMDWAEEMKYINGKPYCWGCRAEVEED
jgi:formylmethanofuran dehydrogenase subunit E